MDRFLYIIDLVTKEFLEFSLTVSLTLGADQKGFLDIMVFKRSYLLIVFAVVVSIVTSLGLSLILA